MRQKGAVVIITLTIVLLTIAVGFYLINKVNFKPQQRVDSTASQENISIKDELLLEFDPNSQPDLRCSEVVNTSKTPPASQELRNKFFPLWEELFLQINNMSRDYFSEHIKIINVSTFNWNEGESLTVDYVFTIDWACSRLSDSILIKPKDTSNYYSIEGLRKKILENPRGLGFKIGRIIPHRYILSYKDALSKARNQCYPSLKPDANSVLISASYNYQYGELLFKTDRKSVV